MTDVPGRRSWILRRELTDRRLSNEERWALWEGFIAGAITRVHTENALRWLDRW